MEELKKAAFKGKRLPRGLSLDIYSYLATHDIIFKIGLLSKKDRESCVNSHLLGQSNLIINMLPQDLIQTPVIPQHAIDVCSSVTLKYHAGPQSINHTVTQPINYHYVSHPSGP